MKVERKIIEDSNEFKRGDLLKLKNEYKGDKGDLIVVFESKSVNEGYFNSIVLIDEGCDYEILELVKESVIDRFIKLNPDEKIILSNY